MLEARCLTRFIRVSPRKMRLLADLVRGRKVNDALEVLQFSPKSAARPVEKAVRSALANLLQNEGAKDINVDNAFVRTVFVDAGPTMKRYLPRAMGRATVIRKRTSHLTVWVAGDTSETAKKEETKKKGSRRKKAAQ
ncbi:50S ribosomal protein L22 [bacterium]|nr:50S ribosomal protein L22 [bacterium]